MISAVEVVVISIVVTLKKLPFNIESKRYFHYRVKVAFLAGKLHDHVCDFMHVSQATFTVFT